MCGRRRGVVDQRRAVALAGLAMRTAGGEVLRTIELGPQPAGLARVSWDGRADDGSLAAEGAYQLRAQTIGPGGVQSAAQVLAIAAVESVTIGAGQGGLALFLRGLGDVPFGEVRRIG